MALRSHTRAVDGTRVGRSRHHLHTRSAFSVTGAYGASHGRQGNSEYPSRASNETKVLALRATEAHLRSAVQPVGIRLIEIRPSRPRAPRSEGARRGLGVHRTRSSA